MEVEASIQKSYNNRRNNEPLDTDEPPNDLWGFARLCNTYDASYSLMKLDEASGAITTIANVLYDF